MNVKNLTKLVGGGNSLLSKRIERCWNAAERVNEITGEATWLLFLDVIYNWFRYGCSDEDFLTMEFYRKNSREKKRWLTSAKNNRYLYKVAYDDDARLTFDHKDVFVKRFAHLQNHKVLIGKESTKEEVVEFLETHKDVIVKPAGGACGVGVYKVSLDDTQAVNDLLSRVDKKEDILIESLIIQHHDIAKVNPYAVNTIRIITMLDRKGNPHIISAMVKFGAAEKCVSNTLAGGICCHIDNETGIIDSVGKDMHGERVFKHPISSVVFPGLQMPNWSGVLNYAKELSRVVPNGRYIGWDIVILEDGYDVIEGNLHPCQDFQGCDGIGRWKQIKQLL